MKIEVRHLARIEGHAHLVVDCEGGELRACRLEVVESPRFFEAFLLGRHWRDVAPIVARVCGVCSHSHTLASLAATEKALGIRISAQTLRLRRLLSYGEILQSHLLQLYFMAVPDYLGVGSLFPLIKTEREMVARALRLKKLGNDLCRTVGGRAVHPVTPAVGGFAALPEAAELQDLRRRLVEALPDLEATVELFARLPIPAFARETEYLCLGGEEYPLLADSIVSSDGLCVPVADYQRVIEEYLVPYSTAKFARATREQYMVGPLARVRLGFERLSPMARTVAIALEVTPNTANPYRSLLARLVEVIHCAEEAIRCIDEVLLAGLRAETLPDPRGGGQGAAAVEAPRGTLFHAYRYGDDGCLAEVDCLIPTAQNLGNIEADLRALVPALLDLSHADLTRRLEMLVRAYDPCISCSTHLVKVDLV